MTPGGNSAVSREECVGEDHIEQSNELEAESDRGFWAAGWIR